MGFEIDRVEFSDDEYAAFEVRLRDSVRALAALFARDGFGAGPTTIGAECELDLIDDDACPAFKNAAVLSHLTDPRVVLEVDRFNLEINARPRPLTGAPFTALATELTTVLDDVARAATKEDARVITIGILPTLRERDLTSGALTDKNRYRALDHAIRRQRARPFELSLSGVDELKLKTHNVAFEGANTSFQVHLKIPPERFARAYNAAQVATAPVLAASTNSPVFLGRRLWDETRIGLFRQSVDDRQSGDDDEWRPSRVSFGHGWVREGAFELFAESVSLHAPLLPILDTVCPLDVVRAGGVPALNELRLHHGTVWRWNRAVYDDKDDGHVRIEFRALPSGPSAKDMAANAAFMIGLTLALEPEIDHVLMGLTFTQARRNFYEAARRGLDATLLYPDAPGERVKEVGARALIDRLLPMAQDALVKHGVFDDDARESLSVVADRVHRNATGSAFQRRVLAAHEGLPVDDVNRILVERYLEAGRTGLPVHTWDPTS